MKQKLLFVTVWMIGAAGILNAQAKDSLAALTAFVNAFSITRQVPVNIRMSIHNSSDVQLAPQDVFSMEAAIQLRENSLYTRFGEVEQLANDSMAIIVSDSLEQIMILPNQGRSLSDRLAGALGMGAGDSSVKKLNTLYRAEKLENVVRLQSRAFLSGTTAAREIAQLDLDAKTGLPVKLLISRRTLVLVDSLQMEELKQQHLPAERFVQRDKVIYLVKETKTTFTYLGIDREDKPLPVTVASRVEKDEAGEWKPVKAYAAYRLVNHTNQ